MTTAFGEGGEGNASANSNSNTNAPRPESSPSATRSSKTTPRLILAVHAGHNASACIGDETGLRYAVQEERLCGEKNYWGYPRLAVKDCLDRVGASAADVLAVAYGSKQVLCRYHSREDVLEAYRRQQTLAGKLRQRVAMPLLLALRPDYGQDALRRHLRASGLGGVPVTHRDHHFIHAATAYYGLRTDPEERLLVLTCDGAGDSSCGTVWVMGGGTFREVARTHWENSLGAIYSWLTFGMGFVPLEHEYKLMGMAPYASEEAARRTAEVFHSFLGLDADGLRFKCKRRRRTNDLHEDLFAALKGVRFDHICAGLQRFTEDLLVLWAANAIRATGVRRVLGSGGVFMNVKANQKIAALAEVDSFESFPSCGDETLPLGALWVEMGERFGAERVPPLRHFYLGGEPDDVEAAVRACPFRTERPADITRAVVELLAAGHPVARCAGRMEFGARALGNRSIFADPRNPDVVRDINQMVKKRDFWMPFAPIVTEERHQEVLRNPKGLRSPYMTMTFDTRENFRDFIAAVHNADLTCRAQILSRDQNPEVHALLTAFAEETGRPVLLNTSFNLHGHPIVRTAAEALDVFARSGLTHVQVGPHLVHKD